MRLMVFFFSTLMVWGLLLWTTTPNVWANERVVLYTYYLEEPYITGKGEGLTYDLATYLTKVSKGQYVFEVEEIPRKRLDIKLSKQENAVLPWANSDWFNLPREEKIYWTHSYQKGANVIITNKDEPLAYKGPESTFHLILFGSLGHHYKGFDIPVKEGKLVRNDQLHYGKILNMISQRKGVFTVISLTLARYLINKLGIEDKVAIAQPYHSEFSRRFLISGHTKQLRNFLETAARNMVSDSRWQKILNEYGLADLAYH